MVTFSEGSTGNGELSNIIALFKRPRHWRISCCTRGYIATYTLHNSRLALHQLMVDIERPDEAIIVNGISPTISGGTVLPTATYTGLRCPIKYSGGILIADTVVYDVHSTWNLSAWSYETVIELIFDNGLLNAALDQSDRIAEIRQSVKQSRDDMLSQGVLSIEYFLPSVRRHTFECNYLL